jgi:L-fucose mutarotase
MAVVPGHDYQPTIWPTFRRIIQQYEPGFKEFEMIERQAFYERTRKAFAVIATSETALYANIILKKGVVVEQ